jgi:hypothetical protein
MVIRNKHKIQRRNETQITNDSQFGQESNKTAHKWHIFLTFLPWKDSKN